MLARAKAWAGGLKRDVVAIWHAARDPRTPWLPRLLALLVAAYALSPIDLIPDFVPVLGYLDDLVLVPLGLLLVIRLLPADVLADARRQAALTLARPRSRAAAVAIVLLWLAAAALALWWWLRP
ncbi:membrane protein [Rubrivivax pictus]|uniref:Membrane protein n=1 Tax=Pseudaquabacterium pictum TaxID=2315236 RepID=A0A480AHQ9_9BURK|nr:membrane protein [Rubrivivax pictus]